MDTIFRNTEQVDMPLSNAMSPKVIMETKRDKSTTKIAKKSTGGGGELSLIENLNSLDERLNLRINNNNRRN